jgi:hypothetical protein
VNFEQAPNAMQIGIVIGVLAGVVIIIAGVLSIIVSWKKINGRSPSIEQELAAVREKVEQDDIKHGRELAKLREDFQDEVKSIQKDRAETLEKLNRELHRIDRCMVAIAVATNAKLPQEIKP